MQIPTTYTLTDALGMTQFLAILFSKLEVKGFGLENIPAGKTLPHDLVHFCGRGPFKGAQTIYVTVCISGKVCLHGMNDGKDANGEPTEGMIYSEYKFNFKKVVASELDRIAAVLAEGANGRSWSPDWVPAWKKEIPAVAQA